MTKRQELTVLLWRDSRLLWQLQPLAWCSLRGEGGLCIRRDGGHHTCGHIDVLRPCPWYHRGSDARCCHGPTSRGGSASCLACCCLLLFTPPVCLQSWRHCWPCPWATWHLGCCCGRPQPRNGSGRTKRPCASPTPTPSQHIGARIGVEGPACGGRGGSGRGGRWLLRRGCGGRCGVARGCWCPACSSCWLGGRRGYLQVVERHLKVVLLVL
mmetsp:Transcript_16215/g.44309  ORF Transcript_16215/g.44309 Transcript_16215/m.44309 type:complete len:212 (+) Transcript_16215:1091-1726(+)